MTQKDIYHQHPELIEQHLHFETLLEHVHESAKAAPKPSVMCDELTHLRERVLQHFAFEEKGGYLHGVLANAEHLKGVATRLFQEHSLLLQQLDKLIEWAKRSRTESRLSVEFVRELEDLLRRFNEHEHRENELLQLAMNEVLPAID